jgi:hypothetical protein
VIQLHPQFVKEDGENRFVVLPYSEFMELKRVLEDAQDLADLREAGETDTAEPSLSLDEVKAALGP